MDRRVKKTKAAVQEAYFSLVMEKDTPKITITELTKQADIDRKTFYLLLEQDISSLAVEELENNPIVGKHRDNENYSLKNQT
jgi:hypothetical protein